MKKRILAVLLLVSCIFLCACGKQEGFKTDKIRICTSFYTVYDFVQKIGGDKVEIINLVPGGTEPHDYEPNPRDLVILENADLLVCNGLGMESWIKKIEQSVNNDKLQIIELADGVDPIENDPHIWLNPLNVDVELKNIVNTLVKLDPKNKEYYELNYDKYKSMIIELDEEYINKLSNCMCDEIVVSHCAFGYLCERYGLSQIGLQGISNEGEPSMQKMAEIIKIIKEKDITAVFAENAEDEKVMNAISKETGAKVLRLNTLENITKEDIESGRDYFKVMETNLDALVLALS